VIGLLTIGGDDADVARLVEEAENFAQRVVVGAHSAESGHGPNLNHRRRCDNAGVPGRFRCCVIDVDRILVADRV
jgi:hypothetical protein